MTMPDPRDAEIAELRAEIAELRARLAALEDFVGMGGHAAAAPSDDDALEIEPGEAWGLRPPGGNAEP